MLCNYVSYNANTIIIRLSKLLARLRAIVPTWETKDTQGSEYSYTIAKIEDPSLKLTQLRNLARGHALSQGRKYSTIEDIPIIIHTALSTARRTMTELKATGLVQMEETKSNDGYNTTFMITLKSEFDWFLSDEFMVLKSGGGRKKIPPTQTLIILSRFLLLIIIMCPVMLASSL